MLYSFIQLGSFSIWFEEVSIFISSLLPPFWIIVVVVVIGGPSLQFPFIIDSLTIVFVGLDIGPPLTIALMPFWIIYRIPYRFWTDSTSMPSPMKIFIVLNTSSYNSDTISHDSLCLLSSSICVRREPHMQLKSYLSFEPAYFLLSFPFTTKDLGISVPPIIEKKS